MRIKIVGVPPGEAPESVRRAWVGLVLPLAKGEDGSRSIRTWGVLSGPKSFLGSIWAVLAGRYSMEYGYAVDSHEALIILEEQAPGAAAWLRVNASHYFLPGRKFLFHGEVCDEA